MMPTVPLEMSEILEESTIVRGALDERRLTSRRSRPPLLRSDGVLLPDRERLPPTPRRSVPLTIDNVSSSALRSEAINHDVDEGLSNFRSQHSRVSGTRPGFTRFEGMMAQMQEMERVLMTDGNVPNSFVESRFERYSANASHERYLSDHMHHSFLGLGRRSANRSVESKIRSDFSDFDRFVSAEFPLPSYRKALKLPSVPKYSSNDDYKKIKAKIFVLNLSN